MSAKIIIMRTGASVTRVLIAALTGAIVGCADSPSPGTNSAKEVIPAEVMTLPVKEDPTVCFPQSLVPTFVSADRVNTNVFARVPERKLWAEEGLVIFVVREKYGFCDPDGRIVIRPQFDRADHFVDGRAMVQVGLKHGYIDRSGALVIEPKFDYAYSFRDGLGCVRVGEKWGVIDINGVWLKEPVYQRLDLLVGGIRARTFDGKEAWVDERGELQSSSATR